MTKIVTAAALDAAIARLDLDKGFGDPRIDVLPRYSGRGMFGATCLGVVLSDSRDLVLLGNALGLGKPSIDNMGLAFVGYWRDAALEGTSRHQEVDEDEDDLVTCDNCDETSESGWGDTPLCVDCQRDEDPDLVCEEHLLTHDEDEACPACKALESVGMAGAIVETTTDDEGETVYFT